MSKSRDIADSAATINYIDGLTSDAQGQLDDKATLDGSPTFTGTVTATAFSGDGSGLTGVDSLPSQTGNAGEFLTTDGSTASWAEISASPTLEATASGTLANGDTVIVNADGTVSVVEKITSSTPTAGSIATFHAAASYTSRSTFDSNSNKIVVVYRNENARGAAVVGTVSGTSVSFGEEIVWSGTLVAYDIAVTFDSFYNKVVIAWRDGGNNSYGTGIVGTVSGDTLSFGTKSVFQSVYSEAIAITFDSNANKSVIAYRGTSGYGTAVVAGVAGTSIVFGSPAYFETAQSNGIAATFDSNSNKVIIAYYDQGNGDYGTAIVGTVSGSSISFGSAVVFEADSTYDVSSAFDSNSNKVVIAYRDNGNGNDGTAVVGNVSGTSISFGSPVVFETGAMGTNTSTVFDSGSNKVVISFSDVNNTRAGTAIVGTVSGTSISFGSALVFQTDQAYDISSAFDSNVNKVLISYRNGLNGQLGESCVFTTSPVTGNLTSANYIGISDGAYADGATAKIQIVGSVDDAQSGLTAGQTYYVQADGSLDTSSDGELAFSVIAGTAVSATKLIVKG